LIICPLAVGNHGEALRVYRRCRELSVVLGLQPTAETQAVYRRVNVNIS
jgi:Bacterial transcriptional activator domain